jgi:hypothetical protein
MKRRSQGNDTPWANDFTFLSFADACCLVAVVVHLANTHQERLESTRWHYDLLAFVLVIALVEIQRSSGYYAGVSSFLSWTQFQTPPSTAAPGLHAA